MNRLTFFLLCMMPAFLIKAQDQDTVLAFQQDEVLFVKPAIIRALPLSVYADTVQRGEKFVSGFDVLFQKLPGVFSWNNENTAQDLRINIRGYGSRASFGIRGIKIVLDGIPMTSPDGTSQIDELSIFMLNRATVYSTNISSSLGNGGGGMLQLSSLPFGKGATISTKINTFGSYDFGLHAGLEKGIGKYNISFSHHRFQSLREHASGKNSVLYNRNRWDFSPKWSVESILHAYYSPEGKDPGAVQKSQIEMHPWSANPNNVAFNAGEEVSGFTVAAKSLYMPTDYQTLRNTVFYKTRYFRGRLPFTNGGITTFDRQFAGWSNDYEWALSKKNYVTFGAGWQWQQDRRKRFANQSGLEGDQDSDQWERVQNVYVTQHYSLQIRKWTFLQSQRLDFFHFSLEDLFEMDGLQHGSKTFRQWNGSVGIQYSIYDHWGAFVNVNTGFETPTLQELSVNPTGNAGLNVQLQPEKSIQYELGTRAEITEKLTGKASFYLIHLNQVISGYEIESMPGRTFYRNVSEGWRKGFTLDASIQLSKGQQGHLTYEFSDFTYYDSLSGAGQDGFAQPLIPKHRLTMQWMGSFRDWMQYSLYAQWYSQVWVNDANDEKVEPQWGLQARIQTGNRISKKWFLGIHLNNLFDTATYSNIRANAAGRRYYEAASPFGVSLYGQWTLW